MNNVTRRAFIKASTAVAAMAAASSAVGQEKTKDAPGTDKGKQTADPFLAGVASRDITPEPGIPLWGYSDREGPATGTLDPLWAKAIALRAGETTAVAVSLDLGRVPLSSACERIRAVARKAGVDFLALTATHTHHAPAMELEDAPHVKAIEAAIGDCIEEAVRKLEPARIGIARTQADIAHNRRVKLDDGRCKMLWRNEERTPTEPLDREMAIIRIDRQDGKPLAALVNFACHPVVMGPSNRQYSADYCGEMARLVKEQSGAECLFLQGACGDLNPYLDKTPMDKGGVEAMRATGRICADAVLAAWPAIQTSNPAAPSLCGVEKSVVIGARFDFANPEQKAILRQVFGDILDRYPGAMKPDLAVPLSVLVVNGNLAFAFMPGEIFVQYQLGLKANSPLPNTFLCGYANDFHGYFPTIRDAAAGGYGGLVATYVGLGAGDKLVTESAIEIGKLAGRLKPVYQPQDFALVE